MTSALSLVAEKVKSRFTFMKGHPEYEEEFRLGYQDQGAKWMIWGAALGGLVIAAFWILDAYTIPELQRKLVGGIQTVRIAVLVFLLSTIFACVFFRKWVVKHYTVLANLCFAIGVHAATFIAYYGRLHGSVTEIYWALTASTSTAIVLGFGASQLPVWNSLLITSSTGVLAYYLGFQVPGYTDAYLGRLLVHISMVNFVCFMLRRKVESREVELFVSMKQQLASDQRAKELAVAREQADRAREAAELADGAKAMFLAGMSHELRTPMHGMLKVIEIVKRNRIDDESRHLLEVGEESGHALLSVLNGILDYTASANGKLKMDVSVIDLHEIGRTVKALHQASARAKGIEFKVTMDVPEGLRHVVTSKVRLLEVINNIASNAVKFTERGGVDVKIGASPVGFDVAQLTVDVRDSGIGIKKADQEKLFTPFWQADQSLGRKQGGTGLGLAMTRKVVDLIGGNISVESVEGMGTRVVATLPLELASSSEIRVHSGLGETFDAEEIHEPVLQAEVPAANDAVALVAVNAPAVRAHTVSARPDRLQGHVLLAEDNHLNFVLMIKELKDLGLSVEVARDGREAVQLFEKSSFDIVLMDCQMPIMDGLEATRRIRAIEAANPRRGRIPILAWTANKVGADKGACLEAGMDDYLSKPHTRQELIEKLRMWMDADGRETEAIQ